LQKTDVDMMFNVCERINESSLLEPHAASLLDIFEIPYTGSNPQTLALCIDKIRVKKLLNFHGIPTPNYDYVYNVDDTIRGDLKFPLIVKPANTDNSIGITNDSVVTNWEQLKKQVEYVIKKIKRPALIEEFIDGDEIDVSILGNDKELSVLPMTRWDFSQLPKDLWHIFPFEAKWEEESSPYYKIKAEFPAQIGKRLEDRIKQMCIDTYNVLDCHDYGRVEIRVDKEGNPYVLELNPNPSIGEEDCVPGAAEEVGMDYPKFVETIVKLAIRRYKKNTPYYHLLSSV
jgi:D-alanine-D-alanine ligase